MLSRKQIGDLIDRALEGRNASDVARQIGMTSQALSNYRTGLRMPSAAFIHALAEVLGKSADEILGLSDRRSGASRTSGAKPADDLDQRVRSALTAMLSDGTVSGPGGKKLEDLDRRLRRLEKGKKS